jgi:hypothetical protein
MNHFLRRLGLALAILCSPAAFSAESNFTGVGNTTTAVTVQLCYALQIQGSWTGDIVLERQSPTASIATAYGTVRTFTANFEGQGGESGEPFNYRLRAGPAFSGSANVRINTVGSGCKPGEFNVTPMSTATSIGLIGSTAAESNRVFKAAGGMLYSLTVTTGASAGFLMLFNATAAPSDGAVVPVYCVPVAANSGTPLRWDSPIAFGTGITAVFSTGASCLSKTASATALFYGQVQ